MGMTPEARQEHMARVCASVAPGSDQRVSR